MISGLKILKSLNPVVRMSDRRVVITGMGVVSPFGIGTPVFWDNLIRGQSASKMIEQFDTAGLPTRFAASLAYNELQLDELVEDQKSTKTMSRAIKFALISAQEAIQQSGVDLNSLDPFRAGVSIGAGGLGLWDVEHSKLLLKIVADSVKTEGDLDYAKVWEDTLNKVHPLTPLKALPNMSAAHIAIKFNFRGHCQTITTACTSSSQAIGEAFRLIKSDVADIVIAGGTDTMINPNGMMSFNALGVISKNNEEYPTAARPFDKRRDGFMVGEGSAIFVLEELSHCSRRNGNPLAEIIGFTSTCDAYRLTDEPAEAWGAIAAMQGALNEAKVSPEDFDLINAHGTGTQMNDKNETHAIKSVFGKHGYSIPVNSTKSMIGHLVAAAGAVEFAGCIKSINDNIIHPTINYQIPDPVCDLDYVPNVLRESKVNLVLSNSFGFGGQNSCLVIKSL
jgi:3-oxoacyl-[acyl-carrier-protein] synthase II